MEIKRKDDNMKQQTVEALERERERGNLLKKWGDINVTHN